MKGNVATVICHEPPDRVELRECSIGSLKEGQVLLETLYSAISPGTELRCLRGEQPGSVDRAFVPGYQAVGRIIATGSNCQRHLGELVFNANAQGFGENLPAMWGAHSSKVIAHQDSVVDLPEGIDLSGAALGKLTAIALHGLKTAGVQPGERVAVIGLGPLGQLSSRLASILRAEVVAFDRKECRVALASEFGIDAACVSNDITDAASLFGWPEKEFDVIIDATGIPQLVDDIIRVARDHLPWDAPGKPATRYVLQGSYTGNTVFNYQSAFLKELTIFLPRDHFRSDIEESLRLIANGKLHLESIVGELANPEDAPSLYNELASGTTDRLTGVFDWSRLA